MAELSGEGKEGVPSKEAAAVSVWEKIELRPWGGFLLKMGTGRDDVLRTEIEIGRHEMTE